MFLPLLIFKVHIKSSVSLTLLNRKLHQIKEKARLKIKTKNNPAKCEAETNDMKKFSFSKNMVPPKVGRQVFLCFVLP